jgi:type II secretory pathway predicted ATPase ExeA
MEKRQEDSASPGTQRADSSPVDSRPAPAPPHSVDWSWFGFTANPFDLIPDPRYFFLSRGHEANLSELLYGIAHGRTLLVMTGAAGMGKTLICRTLLAQLGSDTRSKMVSAPDLKGKDLIRVLARDTLRTRRTILVIDDAETLSDSHLERLVLLAGTEQGGGRRVQIVLSGRPEFLRRLNDARHETLRAHLSGTTVLRPLEHKEVVRYIRYRLQVASGGDARVTFSRAVLNAIWLISRGRPRTISILCSSALRTVYLLRGATFAPLIARVNRTGLVTARRSRLPLVILSLTAAAFALWLFTGATDEQPPATVTAPAADSALPAAAPRPAAPRPAAPVIDAADIVRVDDPADSLKGALATLFLHSGMKNVAEASLSWKIVNFNASILDLFFKEAGLFKLYGIEFHAREADLPTILKVGAPCLFPYRPSRTAADTTEEIRYAVLAGMEGGELIIHDPLAGERRLAPEAWEATLAGPIYYLYRGKTKFVVLKKGDSGIDVMQLQGRLRRAGLFSGSLDGRFDETTHRAVMALQRKIGLTATGVADLDTRMALLHIEFI